jgi:hypothetical protein
MASNIENIPTAEMAFCNRTIEGFLLGEWRSWFQISHLFLPQVDLKP